MSGWVGVIWLPLDVSRWSWLLQPVVQQRCWDVPYSRAELETIAGTFGLGSGFAFRCEGVSAAL